MRDFSKQSNTVLLRCLAVVIAVAFLYAVVLAKLGTDWWYDENYSHGLLVPFVIAIILWKEWANLANAVTRPAAVLGGILIAMAFALLVAGTLGSELFMQRISLVLMLAGLVIYLFGRQVLWLMMVPFALLLLAIPIPQIIFNRVAFPLQIWASQMAVWGIRLFDVPTLRSGNVIDILPQGSTQTISLEVVEACSGIRSLMTLVTLGLILGYFTRRETPGGGSSNLAGRDLLRTIILMVSAIPIAVLTNAARVMGTGTLTYYYGKRATDGTWHDVSGWLVYVVALGLLIGTNLLLKKVLQTRSSGTPEIFAIARQSFRLAPATPLLIALVIGGLGVNWFVTRGEAATERRPLAELPAAIGEWKQRGSAIKFGPEVESVLKTSDYTMREYMLPTGRIGNVYIGYYASQRGGATYHSPQNCLPGAGWVMRDPQYVEIKRIDGSTFNANLYFVENGRYNEVMIYWYQGRGRTEASEYLDKINTVWDSVTRRRTDGSIVRVMASVGSDPTSAIETAADLSGRVADHLGEFVPE